MEIFKQFRFEAAHRLPHVPPEHKCARLHGHSFTVEIHVRGPVGERSGWVVDFADIAAAWQPLHAVLDHYYLNEIPGLEVPTIEYMAAWFWRKLAPQLPGLAEIVIHETPAARCSFKGEF